MLEAGFCSDKIEASINSELGSKRLVPATRGRNLALSENNESNTKLSSPKPLTVAGHISARSLRGGLLAVMTSCGKELFSQTAGSFQ